MYQEDADSLSNRDHSEVKQLVEQGKEDKREQMLWDRNFATIVLFVNITVFVGNLTASFLSGSYSIVRWVFWGLKNAVFIIMLGFFYGIQ
jgi:hypothetical protein